MTIINTILLIVVPSSLAALGLLVYLSSPKSAANRLFLGMAICLAASALGATAFNVAASTSWAFFWVKWTMVFASLLNPILLTFFYTYPDEKLKPALKIVILDLAISLFLAISAFANWLFSSITVEAGAKVIHPGWLIGVFGAVFLCHLLIVFARMWTKLNKARGRQRDQWRYLALGVFTMLLGVAACNVLLVIVFGITRLTGVGVASILFFEVSIFYAITRHHLMDIRLIVARTVAYSVLVAVLLAIYTLGVFGISNLLFHGHTDTTQVLIYAVLAIFVGASFQPLNHWLQHTTEQIFFQTHYDSSDLILTMTKTLAGTYNLDHLSERVLEQLLTTIHIGRGALVVSIDDKLRPVVEKNMPADWLRADALLQLCQGREIVETHAISSKALIHDMRAAQIAMTIPLYVGNNLQGAIVLGDKQSGEVYAEQDVRVLEILGPELAVAIENALSYQQVQEFNQTLRQEVDKATKELVAANEQLSRKNRQLEELDKLKDEFISVTSHELRTPLTAIRGYLWMIINGKKDGSHKLYLDRAYISSERLIDLVNDTLDISRIESGRVQLQPVPTKLVALAKQVTEELEPKAKERHQQLTVRQASHLPAVWCDADKIHQVLTNLIGNALKFTPENGTINVHFYVDKNHLVTAITDTGPGISQPDQKRLFQKFSRVGHIGDVPGTGLGLYLCKQIVDLSKGKIWVDSLEGQGSTFFFSLPISPEQPSILKTKTTTFKNDSAPTA
jgi:signal transduction histidine kinase